MKCHTCASGDTKVIESRDVGDGKTIRRRRECLSCDKRFTTYERIERPAITVIKRDGTKQLYIRDKIVAGIGRATEKTSIGAEQIESIVNSIEEEIASSQSGEVSSEHLGSLIMDELANLDEVAYVRFASVYNSFQDIEGFERALKDIRAKKQARIKAGTKI